jgi:hypothetical protein
VFRTVPLIVMLGVVSEACAFPVAPSQAAHWSLLSEAARDSTGRCDYGLEGALGLGAGVAVLSIIRDRPSEQLAVMVPIGAGLGMALGPLPDAAPGALSASKRTHRRSRLDVSTKGQWRLTSACS